MGREREPHTTPGERDAARDQAGAEQQPAQDLASAIGNQAFSTSIGGQIAARQAAGGGRDADGDDQIARELAQTVQQRVARSPDDERLARDKKAAADMLDDLERSTVVFARGERRWLSANWIKFFGLTSSNPSLGMGKDVMHGLVSNTVGNAVADGAKWVAKKLIARGAGAGAGAAAGGAIGGLPGAAIGFVLGALIETTVGLIYDAVRPSSEEQAAAQASERTAALIENQERALQELETTGIEQGRAKVDEARSALDGLDDSQQVVELHREARSEAARNVHNKPDASELSLAQNLIQEWAMEHAGDENDPNSDTSEAQWEKAVEAGFGGADELEGRMETFAYQTRGHFASVGLDTTDVQQVIELEDPAVPYNGPRAPGSSEPPRTTPLAGDAIAKTLELNDGSRFSFDKARDPEALIRFLESSYAELTDEGKQAIRDGRFKLECRLDLEDDERTVYVNEWEYTLTFPGEGRWWKRTSPPHARRNPLEFSHSPD